jgi:hypothetical protein
MLNYSTVQPILHLYSIDSTVLNKVVLKKQRGHALELPWQEMCLWYQVEQTS